MQRRSQFRLESRGALSVCPVPPCVVVDMAPKHVVVRCGAWKVTTKKEKAKVERFVQRELHTTTDWATYVKDKRYASMVSTMEPVLCPNHL